MTKNSLEERVDFRLYGCRFVLNFSGKKIYGWVSAIHILTHTHTPKTHTYTQIHTHTRIICEFNE